MRAHPSLPVCIIARIDSSVSRLLVTFGDNFLSSGCAGQGMLFCPSLTVYIIAHIALGVLRLCATLYDIVRQLSGVDSLQAGDYRLSRECNRHSIQGELLGIQRKTLSMEMFMANR